MAEVEDSSKQSSPSPEITAKDSGEWDPEGKSRRYGRDTVILRDVDSAVTQEDVLALFKDTEFKVVSAKLDLLNTWFVQMENEEQSKSAVLYLMNKTLRGNPVHARVKTSISAATPQVLPAPVFNPGAMPMPFRPVANSALPSNAPSTSPPPGVIAYSGPWRSSNRPNFRGKPGSNGSSMNNPIPASGAPIQQGVSGGSRQERPKGENGDRRRSGNRSGSEKRGRKQGSSSNTPKQVPFQPQDFPSLSGEVPIKEITPTTTIAPPVNSWAAIAKTIPEKKKEPEVTVPSNLTAPDTNIANVSGSSSSKPTREGKHEKSRQASKKETKTEEKDSKKHPHNRNQLNQQQGNQQTKSRRWEKVSSVSAQPTSETEVTGSPNSDSDKVSAEEKPVENQDEQVREEETLVSSSEEMNGHKIETKQEARKETAIDTATKFESAELKSEVSSSAPTPKPVAAWGTKSFAQVIKEKPAPPPVLRNYEKVTFKFLLFVRYIFIFVSHKAIIINASICFSISPLSPKKRNKKLIN